MGVERGRELGGGERQRVDRHARVAQPHRGEGRDRQPDAELEQLLGAFAQHLSRVSVDRDVAHGIEHDDPVDDVDGRVEVVLDEHDRVVALAGELAEHGVDLVDAGGVEVRRRFVEHEYRGGHREGAGDGEALAPAARQPVGVLIAPLPQADELEGALGARQHLGDRHQLVLGAERDLVEQGAGDHLRVGILEHHRDVRAEHADAVVAAVEPRDANGALECGGQGVRDEPVERERERRLAAPRGAEHQRRPRPPRSTG